MTVLQLKKHIIKTVDVIDNEKFLEKVLFMMKKHTTKTDKVDLTQFVGTIPFKGDSLKFQQKLRAEWGE